MAARIHVVFELTFPNRGSWNGRWSGENDKHYIFKDFAPGEFEKTYKERVIGSKFYRWDDGWTACITSRVTGGQEMRRLKKNNKGFCGYDWMVRSIIATGEIKKEY